MPFIAGESLRSAVEKNGPMPVTDVVRVLYHVGEALDYAHGEGVVHRDIKPANILRSGTYSLVTDFGVAKALNASMPASGMTSTGMAIGTPAYMAPEQLAGDPAADHRIDIYAVGLLAYELLNGRSPFAATTPQKVLAAVLTQDPQPLIDVRPDVPRSLSELVMGCLSKEPDDRPAICEEIAEPRSTHSRLLPARSGRWSTGFTASSQRSRLQCRPLPAQPQSLPLPVQTQSRPLRVRARCRPVPVQARSRPLPVQVRCRPLPAQVQRRPQQAQAQCRPQLAQAQCPPRRTQSPCRPRRLEAIQSLSLRRHQSTKSIQSSKTALKEIGRKVIVGAFALLLPIIAGGIFLSQRSINKSSGITAPPTGPPVAQSGPVQPPTAVQPQPMALPENPVAAPRLDSQAIADSVKKARAEAAKRAAATKDSLRADSAKRATAKSDSLRRAQETARTRARNAAAALLANTDARKAFMDGATHKGGIFSKQTKGNLQTQIDALQPFLKGAGLTYEGFKDIVKASGITLFDEYGRMLLDPLQRFAVVGH